MPPTTRSVRRPGRATAGFSLIEMLAAMAVLAILMVLLGQMFNDSARAMRLGLRGADVNASARAVMDFIARDVSTAMFAHPEKDGPPHLLLRTYDIEPIAGGSPDNLLGLRMDAHRALLFVAPINDPDAADPRETKAVLYRLRHYQQRVGGANQSVPNRYELMRGETGDLSQGRRWYRNPDWSDHSLSPATVYGAARDQGRVVIQNVRSFEVAYWTNLTGSASVPQSPAAETRTDETALSFLDIRLEVLSEEDAIRAAEFWSVGTPSRAAIEFVERAVRRYVRRVAFVNRFSSGRPER